MSLYGVTRGSATATRSPSTSSSSRGCRRCAGARGTLYVRALLSGVTTLDAVPGTVALLCTMIGTTTFDGFSKGPSGRNVSRRRSPTSSSTRVRAGDALQLAFTVGLLVVGRSCRCCTGRGGRDAVGRAGALDELLARTFVHTLTPIALAYVGRALLLVPRLPGPGAGLPRVRPARPHVAEGDNGCSAPRLGDRLHVGRRDGHLVRPGRRARPRPRGGPRARPRPRARASSPTRARRPARNTGCSWSWSPSRASGSGCCRSDDRAAARPRRALDRVAAVRRAGRAHRVRAAVAELAREAASKGGA